MTLGYTSTDSTSQRSDSTVIPIHWGKKKKNPAPKWTCKVQTPVVLGLIVYRRCIWNSYPLQIQLKHRAFKLGMHDPWSLMFVFHPHLPDWFFKGWYLCTEKKASPLKWRNHECLDWPKLNQEASSDEM